MELKNRILCPHFGRKLFGLKHKILMPSEFTLSPLRSAFSIRKIMQFIEPLFVFNPD